MILSGSPSPRTAELSPCCSGLSMPVAALTMGMMAERAEILGSLAAMPGAAFMLEARVASSTAAAPGSEASVLT